MAIVYQRESAVADRVEPEYYESYLRYFDDLGWSRLPPGQTSFEDNALEQLYLDVPVGRRVLRTSRSRNFRLLS